MPHTMIGGNEEIGGIEETCWASGKRTIPTNCLGLHPQPSPPLQPNIPSRISGVFFVWDCGTRWLGPDHPRRTRAKSSVVGKKKGLGNVGVRKLKVVVDDFDALRDKIRLQGCWDQTTRGEPGQNHQLLEKKKGIGNVGVRKLKVVVDDFDALVSKVTLNVLATIPTLQPDSRTSWLVQSTCASGGSFDEFNEIEHMACELIVEWFRTEQIVAKGQVYPSRDGTLHGLPIEPGYVKVANYFNDHENTSSSPRKFHDTTP
nr:hypothetical protein [Tanacetum cinerariifolium]